MRAPSLFRVRYTRKPLLAICATCAGVVMALWALQFEPLQKAQFFAEDSLMRFFGKTSAASQELVFLAIDHASIRLDHFDPAEIEASTALELMKKGWPWSRALYPLILDRLFDAGAKVVVIDLVFPTPREGDEAFRAALNRYGDRVVVASNFLAGERNKGETEVHSLPSSSLITPASPLDDRVGFVNFWGDRDETIRRVRYAVTASEAFGDRSFANEEIIDSLAAKTLKKAGHAEVVPVDKESRRIRFAGTANTFLPHSVCDLFDPKKWASPEYHNGEFFRGKIVIVGPEGNFMKDLVLTPMGFIAGAELQINAINAALQNDFLRETSAAAGYWFIVGGGAAAWVLCFFLRGPLLRLELVALGSVAWFLVAETLFSHAGLFIPVAAPMLAFVSSGVCCLGWDFFLERRERRRIRSVLDRYVAKNVAELVLAESDAFEAAIRGQKRHVTVLFSDIRGFTTMTESADPEELVAQLNEYFFEMVEAVLAEGGTLQQFVGDGILAAWGDTQTLDRGVGAERAVRAALRMCVALEKLNLKWAGDPARREFRFGIGISHGEVIVGTLGHPLRMRFAVVGDAVNTAARLQTATRELGFTVIVGETVEALTREKFHYRHIDRLRVKGKRRAIEAFAPLAEISEPPPPWLEEYNHAIELYRVRNFQAAGQLFQKLSKDVGDEDTLCEMYAGRCERYTLQPPSADWDGYYVPPEK